MHLWLDPVNAQAMVRKIASALGAADPANAARYETNAGATIQRLQALTSEIRDMMAPVAGRPYIVFHDAYRYFEERFGVPATGSITVSPEVIPGAARLREIRGKIQEVEAVCVFAEPQFEPRLVRTVTEGTDARVGELDPLGASIADGPDLYFDLIRGLASSLSECLARSS